MKFKSDIEIAQEAKMKHINEIAAAVGIGEEYIEQYEAFKSESNSKISENEKAIAVLKSEMKSKNNEVKADLEEKLTVLEEKNEALKEKIRDYKQTGDENWEAFKAEFESDMSNLGEALKDLTKNNVK